MTDAIKIDCKFVNDKGIHCLYLYLVRLSIILCEKLNASASHADGMASTDELFYINKNCLIRQLLSCRTSLQEE